MDAHEVPEVNGVQVAGLGDAGRQRVATRGLSVS